MLTPVRRQAVGLKVRMIRTVYGIGTRVSAEAAPGVTGVPDVYVNRRGA
jgi:hypothetical protein